MTVITRFAPSPTGFLHIGGARTALFNFLFAKRHNGKFLLRIEDTDRKRSTPEAVAAILDGMEWLGMLGDEEPVFQFERVQRHIEVAEAMVESGAAFRCFVTPEELQARRDEGEAKRNAAKAEGLSDAERNKILAEAEALLKPFRSPFRDAQIAANETKPFTIRLRAPDSGEITLHDDVQGDITIQADEIDDLILLRADKTPTYMLAVVVDDHDMGVTHIIRGDDHLRNAFRQTPIYQAMGWVVPAWAHLPMIHGDDGAKLSKRHGALGVEAYRDMGYLPEGLLNYLMRLGWSHGDQEYFTLSEASKVFDLTNVNKAPSRIDFDKLADINAHHIQACDNDRLFSLLLPILNKNAELTQTQKDRIEESLPQMKERGNTLYSLAEAYRFLLVERPLELNKKARKALRGEGVERLVALRDVLGNLHNWTPDAIAEAIGGFRERHDLSMGQIGPPLRAALTANLPAPDLNLVAAWLGQAETLARIDEQIGKNTEKTE